MLLVFRGSLLREFSTRLKALNGNVLPVFKESRHNKILSLDEVRDVGGEHGYDPAFRSRRRRAAFLSFEGDQDISPFTTATRAGHEWLKSPEPAHHGTGG